MEAFIHNIQDFEIINGPHYQQCWRILNALERGERDGGGGGGVYVGCAVTDHGVAVLRGRWTREPAWPSAEILQQV